MADFVANDERERLAGSTMDFDVDRALKSRLLAFKCRAQASIQLRIARFPDSVTGADSRKIDVVPPEPQFDQLPASQATRRIPHFIDASTFFFFIRVPGIEYDPVAGLEGRFETNEHLVILDARHCAEVNAAFLAEPGMDKFLVVAAAEPA